MPRLRPHVVVNIAATADGKIDTISRRGAQISSPSDWERVDRLRAGSDAVMVGGRTLLDEDPRLLVKSASLRAERASRGKEQNPIKVGIVSRAEPHKGSRFLLEGNARVMIFTTRSTQPEQIAELEAAGAQVFVMGRSRVDLPAALEALYQEEVRRLLVEGGGTLIAEFFRLRLVDELFVYIAPLIFAGADAPTVADGRGMEREAAVRLDLQGIETLEDGGIVTHYLVRE